MNTSTAFPSKFLEVVDLQGRDITVTISEYAQEQLGQGKEWILYFEGKRKGLILNRTRARSIGAALGTDQWDDWIGQSITLYPGVSNFNGKDTIMVKERAPVGSQATRQATPAQPPPPPRHEPEPVITADDIPFVWLAGLLALTGLLAQVIGNSNIL